MNKSQLLSTLHASRLIFASLISNEAIIPPNLFIQTKRKHTYYTTFSVA